MNLLSHAAFYTLMSLVAIGLYAGLAAYSLSSQPRRTIHWVFAGMCGTIIYYYTTSLILFSDQTYIPTIPLALRVKWLGMTLLPVFYFHFVSHFFIGGFKRGSRIIIVALYILAVVEAALIMFTDRLLAGVLIRTPGHMLGMRLGSLAYPVLGLNMLIQFLGIAGILHSHNETVSPSFHEQTRTVLVPALIQTTSLIVALVMVMMHDEGGLLSEIDDLVLIMAGIFYGRVIINYGYIGGRHLIFARIQQAALLTLIMLVGISATMWWDLNLGNLERYQFPLFSGLLVIFFVVFHLIPVTSQGSLLQRLRRRTLDRERQQLEEVVKVLESSPTVDDVKKELLGVLCRSLSVSGGALAVPVVEPEDETGIAEPGKANSANTEQHVSVRVTQVYGQAPVKLGHQIQIPKEACLQSISSTALAPEALLAQQQPSEIGLYCPIRREGKLTAIFLVGEQGDYSQFDEVDIALSESILRQWQVIEQIEAFDARLAEALNQVHSQVKELNELKPVQFSGAKPVEAGSLPCEIRTLGPLEIYRDGRLLTEPDWGSEKAKGMLAYLIWKGRSGASREDICSLLWPEKDDREAANVFHVTLHHLRRALEPGLSSGRSSKCIQRSGDFYRLNLEHELRIDSVEFEALVTMGTRESLEQAIGIYRGPYMEGVDWALPADVAAQRRYLELLYEGALRRLADRVDFTVAEPYLLRLLASAPADEQANRCLIEGYLHQGNRRRARQVFERWQAIYHEMDLEPYRELLTIWQSLDKKLA